MFQGRRCGDAQTGMSSPHEKRPEDQPVLSTFCAVGAATLLMTMVGGGCICITQRKEPGQAGPRERGGTRRSGSQRCSAALAPGAVVLRGRTKRESKFLQ